jgi:gluconate 5-dehydrogenase
MPLPQRTINQLFDLSGRVALVTGGSRGLGREMAEGLAEAGASLMLCARREEWLTPTLEEFRGRGFAADGMICDVSKASDVQAVVDRAVAVYGTVDILVNNAGISWGAGRGHATRQVAEGHRRQPDRHASSRRRPAA